MSKKFKKIFIYTILSILAIIIIVRVGSFIRVKNSEGYDFAMKYISKNEKVLNRIGEIKSFGKFPSGYVSMKETKVETYVYGTKKDAHIVLTVSKEIGYEWKIINFYFKELE
ncbi:hypothetical protein [Kordia jejudonensis]|uniref:hypothetical protein n=1 Tax=Kordia jejudonensis TaxID=1348245 RepID=UPI0006299F78|nr:hypothetical protein [Kordia jejudonensis]